MGLEGTGVATTDLIDHIGIGGINPNLGSRIVIEFHPPGAAPFGDEDIGDDILGFFCAKLATGTRVETLNKSGELMQLLIATAQLSLKLSVISVGQ